MTRSQRLQATIDAAAARYVARTIGPVNLEQWAEQALSQLILIQYHLPHSPFTAELMEVIDACPLELEGVEA